MVYTNVFLELASAVYNLQYSLKIFDIYYLLPTISTLSYSSLFLHTMPTGQGHTLLHAV